MAAVKSTGRAPWLALAALVALIWMISLAAWMMMGQN